MSTEPESTDPHAPDDALLRRYVLGLTSAEECERIDALSVSSAEVATRLQGIEYDLIDAYAAGQLSSEALTALRSSYITQADWLAEVGFADTLRAWHARAAAAKTPPATAAWMPRGWLAAAAAIALIAIGYLAFDNLSLRRAIEQAQHDRRALDAQTRTLQRELEAQQAANEEIAKQLERTRASLGGNTGPAVPMVIASFLLPAPVRGPNETTSIALPPNIDAVRLQVPLETARFPTVDADIRDATNNQVVWRGAGIRPIGRTLAVAVAANVLKSRTCLLEVRGLRPGAPPELLGPYAFKVVCC